MNITGFSQSIDGRLSYRSQSLQKRDGQRSLIVTDTLHRMQQTLTPGTPIVAARGVSSQTFQVVNRCAHARNILVHEGSSFELRGSSIGDEIFTKRRQSLKCSAPAPQETHVWCEYLVAGANQVIASPCLHINGHARSVVDAIEEQLGA